MRGSVASIRIPWIAVVLSFSLAAIVLNRWIVTELGLLSFGRVWHLHVNYFDFGFTRRALVGTIAAATGANHLSDNAYVAATIIQHAAIIVLVGLLIFAGAREKSHPTALTIALLSPAMVIQSGYTNGSLDVFVLIVAALNCLHVRSLPVFCALVCAGLLVHELFLFLLPAQILCFALRIGQEIRATVLFSRTFILPVTTATITLSLIHLYGAPNVSEEEFLERMAASMPTATGQRSDWSGYDVITNQVIVAVKSSEMTAFAMLMMSLPLFYLAVLSGVLIRQIDREHAAWFVAAGLFPLATSIVASDYYRWVGMAANAQIFMILAASRATGWIPNAYSKYALFWVAAAPLGAAELARPFPLHQFVLERIL